MPRIPGVNVEDLPTKFEPWEETNVYTGVVMKCTLDGPDKNGEDYLTFEIKILDPLDYEGRVIFINYMAIGGQVTPDMGGADRRKIRDRQVRLGQFCAAFKVPPGELDTDLVVGCEGKFTVKNEEYEGQMRPKPDKFLV